MLTDNDAVLAVETVVRSLSTAVKTLRLYPPSSPIPQQAMMAASEAVSAVLTSQPALPLVVAREGFTFHGQPLNAPGSNELAAVLTAHEIAEVDFMPGCSVGELAIFLAVLLRDPAETRADGGTAAAMSLAGAENIVVSQVALTTIGPGTVAEDVDIDEFLRELAGDEQKLAAWLASAAAGDPATLADGLAELARAVGPGGLPRLEQVLGSAFVGQTVNARDAIVGLALNNSDASPLLKGMMGTLAPHDFASSVADGIFAKNMLSMSNVLNALTPGPALDSILAELQPLLSDEGHTQRELSFLNHMIEARAASGMETPLVDRIADFNTVASFARPDGTAIDRARTEVTASKREVNERTVRMMLSLLDQQSDFNLWARTLGNLASMIPKVLSEGDITLAHRVIADLASRESRTAQPWPGLTEKIAEAIEQATSAEAMSALAAALSTNPAMADAAKGILRSASPAAQHRFLLAALSSTDGKGMQSAEAVLGRRIVDALVAAEPEMPWFSTAAATARLIAEPDPRAQQAVAALAHRSDPRWRLEVARGLSNSGSANALQLLAELARDPAMEVSVSAVRSLGRVPARGAAVTLEHLYESLDPIGKDFALAREILGSLARTPDPGAQQVLEKIAGQRMLIKRGHFAEIQNLAHQALASRNRGGAHS